jgi:flagellar basal body-associated protein FliL
MVAPPFAVSLITILIIVVIVLLILGFFGRGRF